MKLCDRCPEAGHCLLDHLGKACKSLRAKEVPDLHPNVAELIHDMDIDQLATFFKDLAQNDMFRDGLLDIPDWLRFEPEEK